MPDRARSCRHLGTVRGKGPVAEREGFEPSVPRKGDNGFRDRPVRPLRHLSAIAQSDRPRPTRGRTSRCCHPRLLAATYIFRFRQEEKCVPARVPDEWREGTLSRRAEELPACFVSRRWIGGRAKLLPQIVTQEARLGGTCDALPAGCCHRNGTDHKRTPRRAWRRQPPNAMRTTGRHRRRAGKRIAKPTPVRCL